MKLNVLFVVVVWGTLTLLGVVSEKTCMSGELQYMHEGSVSEIDVGLLNFKDVTVEVSQNQSMTGTKFVLTYTAMISNYLDLIDVFATDSGKVSCLLEFLTDNTSSDGRSLRSLLVSDKVFLSSLAGLTASLAENGRHGAHVYGLMGFLGLCGIETVYGEETCVATASLKITLPYGKEYSINNDGTDRMIEIKDTPSPTRAPSTPVPSNSPFKRQTNAPTQGPTNIPTRGPTPLTPTAPPGTKQCFVPESLSIVTGSKDGSQTVNSVQVLDHLSCGQDSWTGYIEVVPVSNVGADFRFTFDVSDRPKGDVNMIDTTISYMGNLASVQLWELYILNLVSGEWELVNNNVGAPDWCWFKKTELYDLTSSIVDYISAEGKVQLKYSSTSSADVCDLDFLSLCLTSGTFSPTAAPTTPPPTEPYACPDVPEGSAFDSWAYKSLICGVHSLGNNPSDETIQFHAAERFKEGCTAIMLDTRLSMYLTEDEFDAEVDIIRRFSDEAIKYGMKTTIYYPTTEIVTNIPEDDPNRTAYHEHKDWVQYGLNGEPNVFTEGGTEVWVYDGQESAWMDPESPGYLEYFLNRIAKLAGIQSLGAVWGDVPLYYESGSAWAGGSEHSRREFKIWSNDRGLCPDTQGCPLPQPPTYDGSFHKEDVFRYWLIWRHHSLARFLDRIRSTIKSVNPNCVLFAENYVTDYMDASLQGLDAPYYKNRNGLTNVWEIDSVSNNNGMKWAKPEDFANQLTMRKYIRGVDRESPSWAFAYTNEAIDMGFILAGAFAVGTPPLECKTPTMATSADTPTRTRWFNWAKEFTCQLFLTKRVAKAVVIYSSLTRDFHDLGYPGGGGYGMYNDHTPIPSGDTSWWTKPSWGDSAVKHPHLGAYRGAAYAMEKHHIPFKIVDDVQMKLSDFDDVSFVWLPNTVVLSDEACAILKQYVANGGTLLASGEAPAQKGAYGFTRSQGTNPLQEVFGGDFATDTQITQTYGSGVSVYRQDLDSRYFFKHDEQNGYGAAKQAEMEKIFLPIVRAHVPEMLAVVNGAENIFIEVGEVSDDQTQQVIYAVNYNGFMRPTQHSLTDVQLQFKAPFGKVVRKVMVETPDVLPAYRGSLDADNHGNGWATFDAFKIDQFALIMVYFEDDPNPLNQNAVTNENIGKGSSTWKSATRKQIFEDSFNFITNKMREPTDPFPYRYGVFTNYKEGESNGDDGTYLYAYAHHKTSEHLGLYLRVAACGRKEVNYNEAKDFATIAMPSPLYKVLNWAIDGYNHHPFLTFDDYSQKWIHGTAALDDLRTILGLLEGDVFGYDANRVQAVIDALHGIYWTEVSFNFPEYPGGIMGYSWDWQETNDATRNPPAKSTGVGALYDDDIPVDYQDVDTIHEAAKLYARFIPVLQSSVQLLLDAEIGGNTGLFYNTYKKGGTWAGDFEEQGESRGLHLKVIQELWIGIHLAKVKNFDTNFLSEQQKQAAGDAADRMFEFFKTFYDTNGRIPEYLTYGGLDVEDCPSVTEPNCLKRSEGQNSINGEARIYSQFVRLGYLLNKDSTYLDQVIDNTILPNRITDNTDPRFGMFGKATAGIGDADAWNTLETLLTLCMVETKF